MSNTTSPTSVCEFCGRVGSHTAAEHPLPTIHPDYDAFFDASDSDLATMASEAINRFHNRT
jgi:hypothetical protein